MGYRSDIRIVMYKEDYNRFIERAKENLKELTDDENILNDSILTHIDIYTDINTEYYKNQVYFGWNYLKWYEGYPEIEAVNKALEELEENGKGYVFERLGEDYNDYEEIDRNINYELYYPQLIRQFDDNNI